jgi:hypothetical protein
MIKNKALNRRKDYMTCAVVQVGISMAAAYGEIDAAAFMMRRHVKFDVILRTTLWPERCRMLGTHHMAWECND